MDFSIISLFLFTLIYGVVFVSWVNNRSVKHILKPISRHTREWLK